jgi:hypothetical protein
LLAETFSVASPLGAVLDKGSELLVNEVLDLQTRSINKQSARVSRS